MKEHVTSYEEAIRVHYEFVESEVAAHNRMVYKRQIALMALGMTVAFLVLGFACGYPTEMLLAMTPSIAFVTFLAYLPYRQFLKAIDSIKDNSYFKDKDEDSIIEGANRYIDSYNEHVLS